MIKNYLKLTLKLLKRRKIYTTVSLLGIIIPMTLIIMVSSIFMLFSAEKAPIKDNLENLIFLERVSMKEIAKDGWAKMENISLPSLSFVNNYVRRMKSPEAIGMFSNSGSIETVFFNNKEFQTRNAFTDDNYWKITDFNFLNGRPYNTKEYNASESLIVIDRSTSEKIFGTIESVGKTISIKNKNYKVIGIISNIDITQYRYSANIYIPYSCREDYNIESFENIQGVTFILLKNKNDFEKANNELQQLIKKIDYSKIAPINKVEAKLIKDSYSHRIQELFSIGKSELFMIIAILIFFFIIFPAINLTNISMNRIIERLPESGIRKTFGAPVKKIITQLIIENTIVVFIGSIISLLLSLFVMHLINDSDLFLGVQLKLNYIILVICAVSVLIIGCLSAIIPAYRIAKYQIVSSLNSEK